MAHGRRRRSRSEWIEICREFSASAQTAKQYAGPRGLHPGTLLAWRSRLRREGDLDAGCGGATFVEVVSGGAGSHNGYTCKVCVGSVTLELSELPPASWVAELSSQC